MMPATDGSPEASASRISVVLALGEVRIAQAHRAREVAGVTAQFERASPSGAMTGRASCR